MTRRMWTITAALAASILLTCAALGGMMMVRGHGAKRPAAGEFGPGPRTSAQGLYVATLQDADSLKPRKMYTLQVSVTDATGMDIDGASIDVDGGMPQHGHGYPTRPRVTRNLGGGAYEISGLRFNMGGWWELKLTIATPAGTDTVTFNLDVGARRASTVGAWTPEQIEQVRSLALAELEPLPADPTNRVADDPRAVALGQRLFFDASLSSNGRVSCATCHIPDREFQDDKPLATGVGTTGRRTMPIAGTAYMPFLFWDGRKDSLWSQALGPLESPVEHGGTRAQYAHVVAAKYRQDYEALFGPMPDLSGVPAVAGPVQDQSAAKAWSALPIEQRLAVTSVYVNIGKAIAAYERKIQYGPSRFDRYAEALTKSGHAPSNILTRDEAAGLALFIGKANCIQCHNGPLFTNNEFHNTGVPAVSNLPADSGRLAGATAVLTDEFNCRSRWSDATATECAELDFMVTDSHELERAFKVPSLRNVADRAPYMHAGQLATLDEVVDHYNRAPAAPAGHSELKPLKLTSTEVRQLTSFLRALSGGTEAPAELLRAPVQ